MMNIGVYSVSDFCAVFATSADDAAKKANEAYGDSKFKASDVIYCGRTMREEFGDKFATSKFVEYIHP